MTHDDALDLVAAAIDFTLSPAERTGLDAHLAICSGCRADASAMRATAVRLSDLRPVEPPDWVWARVMRPRQRPLALSVVTAALVLAALVGVAIVVGTLLQDRSVVVVPTSPPGPVPSASQGIESLQPSRSTILVERAGALVGTPSILELIATPDGFLAHGLITAGIDNGDVAWDGTQSGLILRGSPDGSTWQALDAQSAFGSLLDSIAVGPNGYVAARRIEGSGDSTAVEVWRSNDGRTWESHDSPTWVGNQFAAPIYGGRWGYAMEGLLSRGGDTVPAVWVSRDGRTWGQMPLLEGNGYLVVHDAGVLYIDHETGLVRETRDGRSWTQRTSLPVAGAVRLVALGSRVVAVAPAQGIFVVDLAGAVADVRWELVHDLRDTDDALAVAAVASRANRAVILAYDRELDLPIALASSDGVVWIASDLDPGVFGGGVPGMLVGGDTAFLALGWDVNAIGDTRPRAWASADGRTWAPAGTAPLVPMPPVTTPSCPADPSLEDLVSPTLPASARPVCFGNRAITLRGFAHDCGGCGGVTGLTGTPAWLADPLRYSAFWIGPTADAESLRFGVEIDPASGLAAPTPGTYLELTGHFSDAASETCRFEPFAGEFAHVPPVPAVQATCRERFVATAIRVITPASAGA